MYVATEVNPPDTYKSASHTVVRQLRDSYPNKEAVEIAIRRVRPYGTEPEELQIEIELTTFGKKRTMRNFGTIVVSPEIADIIAKACSEERKLNGVKQEETAA
jgi:hypothetical protein